MTRLTFAGNCKCDLRPRPTVEAPTEVLTDSPSKAPSATLPIPAADVPKKCRRETRCTSSIGCESHMAGFVGWASPTIFCLRLVGGAHPTHRSYIVASRLRMAWQTTASAATWV